MSRNRRLLLITALAASVLIASPALGANCSSKATLTSVRGTVLVHSDGEGSPMNARSGMTLKPGARLEAQAKSRATILLPWGAFKVLRSGESYLVPVEAPSESGPGLVPLSEKVASVFLASREKTGQMEKLDIRAGTRSAEGGPTRLIPLSPRNTAIMSQQPTLVWSSYPGAKEYKVTVIGDEGRLFEATTSTPSLPLGADAPKLKPGATYFWEVAALTPAAQIPSGKVHFSIMEPKDLKDLRDLIRRIRKAPLPDKDDSSSHYLMANLFIEKGLYEEAARSLLRAARMNPDDQGLLDLLQGVYREMQLDSQGIAYFQELI